jgi:hypothetical protein
MSEARVIPETHKDGTGCENGLEPRFGRLGTAASIAILFLLCAAMFFPVLLSGGSKVLSLEGGDLSDQFVYYRQFGFEQLGQGNLPLWNPHVFSGTPFFSGFQQALLYPPNLLHLLLPVGAAINWIIAIHVLLAGIGMLLWLRRQEIHPVAALFGGALFMFCGPLFLHIHPGHLSNLCTMAWTPLLFLAVDLWIEKPNTKPILLGVFAVSMQILAGHPQYVYYAALAVGLFALLRGIQSKTVIRTSAAVAGMYIGAALATAVQLLPGLMVASESVRTGGLPYDFAAMFSFPPENFITLAAPWFFGDLARSSYWGRGYLWEFSLFFGFSGFALALGGLIQGRGRRAVFGSMAGMLLLLALGTHTPLHRILFDLLPAFDQFRGSSKMILPAGIFLIALSATGLDALIRKPELGKKAAVWLLIAAAIPALTAGLFHLGAPGGVIQTSWSRFLLFIGSTGESYFDSASYLDPSFVLSTLSVSAGSLAVATAKCLLLAFLLFMISRSKRWIALLLVVAIAEVFLFAKASLETFDLESTRSPILEQIQSRAHPDDRVLNLAAPSNSAMVHNAQDIWGYDPGVSRRYSRLIHFANGENPDRANQYMKFSRFNPIYRMLRCRVLISQDENGVSVTQIDGVLPRLLLVKNYRVVPDDLTAFEILARADFDPRRTVLLEEEPDPKPVETERADRVRVVASSTDHLDIEADLSAPAILLITDAYAKGWSAKALPGSVQQEYRVLPANTVLRAIPLQAGRHLLRTEYSPAGFQAGKWISIIFLMGLFAMIATHRLIHRNTGKIESENVRTF